MNDFNRRSTAEKVTEGLTLAGKCFLITGCNSGLGLESMRVLTLRGAKVIALARTLAKAREACKKVCGETVPLECDLSNPQSIKRCIKELIALEVPLDVILCNAGIMALPHLELCHGIEKQFFVNHIGHFILVNGLLERLTKAARIVVVSSIAHRFAPKGGIEFDNLDGHKGYSAWRAYGQSKFANILFAKELSARFKGSARTANAVHPGIISTKLTRNNRFARWLYALASPFVIKSVETGAATQVYVATNPKLANLSGKYFSDCQIGRPRSDVDNPQAAKRLWELSEEIARKFQ